MVENKEPWATVIGGTKNPDKTFLVTLYPCQEIRNL
jgi:hypothetical protein